jgi:hypothetical protein
MKKHLYNEVQRKAFVKTPETTNVARATCSLLLNKIENSNLKFQENLKLNLHIVNVVIYKHANFQV